jgi:ABC-type nitrate/sulfonate/bicarbonate transport system substrate-binding protein
VALKRGFKPLVNAADLGLEYQLGGIIARQAFIDANPELTRRFVRAYVRGIHRCRTDLDFTVGVLCKYSHLEDEEVARESARWQDHCFQPKPYPTIKGLQTILRQLSEREPAARTASADAMTDMRWLRELDETGFFDALYQESAHV